MNALTPITEATANDPLLETRETIWGFIVAETAGFRSADFVMQMALRFIGATMVFASAALWMLPGAMFSADVYVMKLMLFFLFCGAGAVLYGSGTSRWRREIEIDVARRQIRVVERNGRGRRKLSGLYSIERILKLEAIPVDGDPSIGALLLSVSGQEPMVLTHGRPAELRRIVERFEKARLSPAERVETRLQTQAA